MRLAVLKRCTLSCKEDSQLRERQTKYDLFCDLCVRQKMDRECCLFCSGAGCKQDWRKECRFLDCNGVCARPIKTSLGMT